MFLDCHASCLTCESTSNNCTTCDSNSTLQQSSNNAIPSSCVCNSGYYLPVNAACEGMNCLFYK